MQDIIDQVLGYLRGIWRYRWFALGLAWVVCLGGWFAVYQLPDEYEASARVYVDTQSALRPLLKGLTMNVSDPNSQVTLMTRTLLSRPNLEKIARMTDLDLRAKNSAAMDSLFDDLEDDIALSRAGRENLYSISYVNENPNLAKKVVQSLLTIYVENTLGGTRQDSTTATKFIDRQIADYEKRLLESEKRLTEFKRLNVGMMPSDGSSYYQRMESAKAELEAARLELRQAQERRGALERQIVGEEPTFGFEPRQPNFETERIAPTQNLPVQARIQQMELQLDMLLLKYTEKHPDVVIARQLIAEMEKQLDKELAVLAANQTPGAPAASFGGPVDLNANPVYQQLKITLGTEEATIAALQALVEQKEEKVKQLQGKVHTVPEVEAELVALNRDYDVTRSNYEELLARREAAHLSQQAEQTTDDIRFKVIDPPRVPTEPSGPQRPVLASGVLVFGLGFGLALAFLLSQIRQTFDSRLSLTSATDLPVLGTVGIMLSRAVVRRQRFALLVFLGAAVSLLMLYAGMLALEITGGLRVPYMISSLF